MALAYLACWTLLDECIWIMKCVLWGASYFRHSDYQSLVEKAFDGNILTVKAVSAI